MVATAPNAGALDQAAVIDRCRRELPAFMVPHHVVERTALPRNANGKIDRKFLASALAEEAEAEQGDVA